jgi:hypothetical protein
LTGPGKIFLQSLPLSRLADRIMAASRVSTGAGESRGVAGMGGDFLKDILSGS